MHTLDLVLVVLAVLAVLTMVTILARQRYMMRMSGAVPVAVQRGQRWLYGTARYQDGELRWYRALGIGTRPSRVLRRGEVELLSRRGRLDSEAGSLPESVVVVECRADGETFAVAFGSSAFTGFVSWLEAAPI